MYSSQRIDSVTCLRLSSRWILAQSGSTCRRWPCLVPISANNLASSAVSVSSSGSGQLSPAAWKRLIVVRTVDAATPIRRAISRVGTPPTNFNRSTSRTWCMAVLSAGIRSLLRKAEGADLSRPAETPAPRARSSRNGGRDHLGKVGELISEWRAASPRNQHHVVGPGLTAGENDVGMPVQPIAGRPAGCQHLVHPSLPRPQPDWIDMGIEDEINGNHQADEADSMKCVLAASPRRCRRWRMLFELGSRLINV